MHTKLHEIIKTKPCCRETIREASQYLPEDEDELDGWIAEALENNDVMSIAYVLIGAMHRGLPVQSRHLERALKFFPSYESASYMVHHVSGDDVPARVARALQLGAISPNISGSVLVTTWYWCAERGLPFPKDMLGTARGIAHRNRTQKDPMAMFLHLGVLADDLKMQEMVLGASVTEDARGKVKKVSEEMDSIFRRLFQGDILDTIAEKPPQARRPKTLRRAVEHIGRNDPCPCGSGKKHKRCCFEKTRERLLHSSDVAGMTMDELGADLEAHMTLGRLKSLYAGEVVKLDPLKLDPALLPPLIDRLSACKLFDEATAVLEKVGLTDERHDQWEHLLILAAEARRKKVVWRLVSLHPNPANLEEKDYLHISARLLLAEDDAEKTLAILEETARMLVDADVHTAQLYFHGMGFVISPLGALGIMLTQAVVTRMEIKEALQVLDLIMVRRATLDLPLEDPLVAVIDRRIAIDARKEENKDSAKLAAAMRKMDALAEKERKGAEAARQMEKELAKLTKQAARRKEPAPDSQPHDDREMKELREKLRIHEANEKINAEERAAHRRATSELLLLEQSLREKERKLKKVVPPREESEEDTQVIEGELEGTQSLRVITFPDKFLKTINPFPKHVGRQALTLLGRIASGEPAAFHDVLRLKACHDVFRARVGIDHRMLFRLHAEELEVIALIDRRDLDARIKTLRS